jgi:hypothetical protein
MTFCLEDTHVVKIYLKFNVMDKVILVNMRLFFFENRKIVFFLQK